MSTTRTGSGLAFTPEKDLEMFADMARRGKRLTGVSLAHHGWRFDDAEPECILRWVRAGVPLWGEPVFR